jgi:hypothetical protein
MITILAYNLLSTIACGEVTVHTLHLGILARTRTREIADEILLNGLLELCDKGYVVWQYHPMYGDQPSVAKVQNSSEVLLETWKEVFGFEGPRTEEPNFATISFDLTRKGNHELGRSIYGGYEEFLDNWYS